MQIFEQNDVRISLITSRLLRTEKGNFTDLPTQTVQDRCFCEVEYTLSRVGSRLFVRTSDAIFEVDINTADVVSVELPGSVVEKNFYSKRLPGTVRTLDTANGAIPLEDSIMSTSGVSVMDDSSSLILTPEGEILQREKCSDRYWFAYRRDYLGQLKDFFRLTGSVPLIPKFALGNWWSRYRAYTQEEYRSLMKKFISRDIPITVATIDMDWHWVDVVDRFGRRAKAEKPTCPEEVIYNTLMHGWTGYSWNTELFPDHRELLSWLHDNGFRVTLNVHPSQGVRFFEDRYADLCRALNRNPDEGEVVRFDPTDPEFMKAYFEILHHPLEAEGVDFWWIDWQQGTKTRIPGLDPLWALNHYHTLDSAGGNRRPLILSRYSGLGSHRFPLGFSGDTHVSWKSLDFQPYFTNSAANSGYTWWSHDIGGHMRGVQDDELYLRWLQYGVFSPINRLHSSNSDFMGKEPWKRCYAVSVVAEDFLRLRHRLIPSLYTANYRTHKEGEPICMPMYYRYNCEDAYKAKNQYIFCGSLLVCPITRPADKRLNLAYADVWLPEGRWTDIFSGRAYRGGRWVRMYRDIDSIPVLAPEGTILPMYRSGKTNSISLDQPLEINVWRGEGAYDLYEDDGETKEYENGRFAITSFRLTEKNGSLRLIITPPKDGGGILPKSREMYIKFCDVDVDEIKITVADEPVVVEISDIRYRKNENKDEIKSAILTRVQGSNDKKSLRFGKKLPSFVLDALSEMDAYCEE